MPSDIEALQEGMTRAGQGDEQEQWKAFLRGRHPYTVSGVLGIELEAIDDAHAAMTMPITDAARQPFGLLHGGVSLLLAESAASTHACWGVDLTQVNPVGIEVNGSHLRSATEGTVRAVATVVRRSPTFIVHQVEIAHVETGKLLCTARVTNYYKRIR